MPYFQVEFFEASRYIDYSLKDGKIYISPHVNVSWGCRDLLAMLINNLESMPVKDLPDFTLAALVKAEDFNLADVYYTIEFFKKGLNLSIKEDIWKKMLEVAKLLYCYAAEAVYIKQLRKKTSNLRQVLVGDVEDQWYDYQISLDEAKRIFNKYSACKKGIHAQLLNYARQGVVGVYKKLGYPKVSV